MITKALKFNFEARTAIFALACAVVLSVGLRAQDVSMILLTILFLVLSGYFVFQRRVNLFEPFTLFTLYYLAVFVVALYLYLVDISNSDYIDTTSFYHDSGFLFKITIVYCIFGYLCAFCGYKTFVRRGHPLINFKDGVSLKIVKLFIPPFVLVGVTNFLYNVYVYAGGDLLNYMQNISVRKYEFEEGGTTLGYLFVYTACYLWFYVLLKQRKMSYLFMLLLILAFLMKVSTGRIFSSVSFVMSFVAIYYLVSIKGGGDYHKNSRYILAFVLMGIVSLVFYFLRVASSLLYNHLVPSGWLATAIQFIDLETIFHFIIVKGNLPNIPILMKIVDSWGTDIGFLYGESLLSWAYQFLPSSLRPIDYRPSDMIKNIWYPHIIGGALPPTGIGEMYANFGVLGPFIGMFIFGSFVALLKNLLFKFNNYWYLAIYVQIAIGFVMIYPKGEFDNLSPLFVLPILFSLILIKIFQCIARQRGT